MLDLQDAANRKLLAKRISDDIDAFCQKEYGEGHRTHLGASKIGHACSRHLWYVFRWIAHRQASARMQRLWNRGHEAEGRFIGWLRGIGCQVWDLSDDGNQHRIYGVSGHYGGSLDGVARLPERYVINQPMLLEFKTNKTGADFNKLKKEGMKIAKPLHWAQACSYGRKYDLKYCLYMCIDKNTDEIYVEIVELDFRFAEQMEQKAHIIIHSDAPPPKLSESSTYHVCKMCDHSEVCHKGAQIERNCRSCKMAMPIEDKQWFCHKWQAVIPKEAISEACNEWKAIV